MANTTTITETVTNGQVVITTIVSTINLDGSTTVLTTTSQSFTRAQVLIQQIQITNLIAQLTANLEIANQKTTVLANALANSSLV